MAARLEVAIRDNVRTRTLRVSDEDTAQGLVMIDTVGVLRRLLPGWARLERRFARETPKRPLIIRWVHKKAVFVTAMGQSITFTSMQGFGDVSTFDELVGKRIAKERRRLDEQLDDPNNKSKIQTKDVLLTQREIYRIAHVMQTAINAGIATVA